MLRHAPLPSHSDHPAELGFKGWGRGLFKVGEGNLLRLCRSHRQIPIPHLPKMRGTHSGSCGTTHEGQPCGQPVYHGFHFYFSYSPLVSY